MDGCKLGTRDTVDREERHPSRPTYTVLPLPAASADDLRQKFATGEAGNSMHVRQALRPGKGCETFKSLKATRYLETGEACLG